ncbi:MAG: TolB family protein [Deinococcales bacterium]
MKPMIASLLLLALVACPSPPTPPVASSGTVTYTLGNDVYRISTANGSSPENISALVAGTNRKPDRRLNISPNGAWLVFETQNLNASCAGNYCLAVAPSSNPKAASVVSTPNLFQNSEGFPAISSDGDLIVYTASGGTHNFDLWAIRKINGTWAAATQITQSSTQAYNDQPALSSDGNKVLFDCGSQPFGEGDSKICEIGTDGTGFRVVVSPAQAPAAVLNKGPVHHADYLTDGSIIFDATWDEDVLYKIAGSKVSKVSSVNNEVAPCGLANGQIISLWLERSGNSSGAHELKIMDTNGANPRMLVQGVDIADIGIGCGG